LIGQFLKPRHQALLALCAIEAGQILGRKQLRRAAFVNALDHLATHLDDGRAQDGLALDQRLECTLERACVHLATQAMRRRRVVDHGAGIELFEQPQALLQQRKRREARILQRRDRSRLLFGRRGDALADGNGKGLHRGILEQQAK
jgi:hypothetical protein